MPLPALFHLAVDDGGEFLVFAGEELVLGHLRSERAELRFLADVEREHARLSRRESFHGGVEWRLEALGEARVEVGGQALAGDARTLAHGDRVQLGSGLALRFRALEAASSSALLELEGPADCEGVRRVLLLSPGRAGRVRIGSKRGRPIPVPDLERELALELEGDRLLVRCEGGLRCGEVALAPASDACLALGLPLAGTRFVETGARARGRAPFTLTLRPSDHHPARSSP